ncbi:acetyl-CoA acetyltransferase [Thermodesulfobacteriota bacterium]
MSDDLTPIIVGAGQFTEKDVDPAEALGPMELMVEAAERATEDAGIGKDKLARLDMLVAVRSAIDAVEIDGISNDIRNPPEALAMRIGAHKAKQYLAPTGGNTPQTLVNYTAEQIAQGRVRFALLCGAEALDTLSKAIMTGLKRDWRIPSSKDPELIAPEREGTSRVEEAYGLELPIYNYPLFENALRGHYGHTIEAHQQKIARLFSRFTDIAAQNPYAWFPVRRSPEEIATPSAVNRYISFPYTKLMTAIMKVNQSAALLMTSAGFARELDIDESRWIYLHGCADTHDHWYITERENYYSSPAIAMAGEKTLQMAGMTIDDMDYFDFYSCFPSVVEIARDMLGIAEDDPRDLTVTGGLPYHGGPGSNYVMHSVATMVDKLRRNPGTKGLVTANGWYVTKHSFGIYSSDPPTGAWYREDPAVYQAQIDARSRPEVVHTPSGSGTVETYTVVFGRDGEPEKGIVIGRLKNGRRFLANTPKDKALLENMTTADPLGLSGTVRQQGGLSIFSPR